MNDLAYFLIDKDRNLNQGMELVDKYQITYFNDNFECSSSGDLGNLYGNYTIEEDISLEDKDQVLAEFFNNH